MSSVNYGTKRIVTGAHYGASDWLVQRASAVVIIAFTAIILAHLLLPKGPIGHELWAGIFAPQWMKFITASVIVSVLWHAWCGSWAALPGVLKFCGAFKPLAVNDALFES